MQPVRNLSGKAKNAVLRVLSVLYRTEGHSLDLFVKLFDFQIRPILLYGLGLGCVRFSGIHRKSTVVCIKEISWYRSESSK